MLLFQKKMHFCLDSLPHSHYIVLITISDSSAF